MKNVEEKLQDLVARSGAANGTGTLPAVAAPLTGYALLGRLLEKITGRSYGELCREPSIQA
jgi:hypothetical protein